MATRLVYFFGDGRAEGGREDKSLLGGKGANLAEMTRIGVPVPPGFIIPTTICNQYLEEGRYPEGLRSEVEKSVRRLEKATGKTFGGTENPLLVSVRSGAAVSMPGMMDTILNLGLNDETAAALARAADDERFAFDSYRRFVQMYGDVVKGVPSTRFEERLRAKRDARGVEHDTGLSSEDLRELVAEFKALMREETGEPFPEDPEDQLWGAIEAVFGSWNNERAISYRRAHRIPSSLGTAVSVVTMVYGNMGESSGTGVAFTRSPSTGDEKLFGEFLLNAQGEDVVAGIRDPLSIDEMADALPEAYEQLVEVAERLERHYTDMQDLEFTVERGTLYLLQTRTGKRTAAAAVQIACDMVDEGLIGERTAILRVDPRTVDQLLHPQVDRNAEVTVLARGLPASPGAAAGAVVFDPETAKERAGRGEDVILVREETSPDDFDGMMASRGILTARGGMTSHAAVVARGIGKCCVVGAREVEVYGNGDGENFFRVGDREVREGEWITLDGTEGRVLEGEVPTVDPDISPEFRRIMAWADEHRRLGVRTNADTPQDAARARDHGAEGIGLCRTEHMFFEGERLHAMREMILAADYEGRERALAKLLPYQREDFIGIFEAMDGLPVTVRLLDPPLHEFLPRSAAEDRRLAERLGLTAEEVRDNVARHRESNPMLGHRGVRLAMTFPEITEMQTRAIMEAAVEAKRRGVDVRPEIMIPLVGIAGELASQREVVERIAREVLEEAGEDIAFLVGTMIEVPRAALTAAEIAEHADFFSFGTNDLTQTTFGISRDDAGSFLPFYIDQELLGDDPFACVDTPGVGRLVEIASREGREAKPELKLGVCGEHGGEPRSVVFFHGVGLDYVSCSPFRVPVARLAAAHAALLEAGEESQDDEAAPTSRGERDARGGGGSTAASAGDGAATAAPAAASS